MKHSPGTDPVDSSAALPAAFWRIRPLDYIELTKPKLTSLILFTTFVGFCAGSPGSIPPVLLLHTLIGTALMSGGASAFNMFLEQDTDAAMGRTSLRPLAAGRIQAGQALVFALAILIGGFVYLYAFVNHLTSLLSAIIFAGYIFLYTPLKTKTWLCTLVGAVPGALPIVMGWAAANRTLSSGAWILFAIVFFWQIPHFCAIAWIYRDEYARAGLAVLSVVDRSGHKSGRHAVAFIVALMLASLLPALNGMAGHTYPAGAVLFGSIFLICGIRFARLRDRRSARHLFLVSALYLPALLILLLLDRLSRLVSRVG